MATLWSGGEIHKSSTTDKKNSTRNRKKRLSESPDTNDFGIPSEPKVLGRASLPRLPGQLGLSFVSDNTYLLYKMSGDPAVPFGTRKEIKQGPKSQLGAKAVGQIK